MMYRSHVNNVRGKIELKEIAEILKSSIDGGKDRDIMMKTS